jgi:hypothetical protein
VGPDLPLDTSRAGTLQAAIVSAAWLRVSVSSLLLLLGRALHLLGPWPAWGGLLGVRLAAGGWRLAVGSLAHARLSPSAAPERVHRLGLALGMPVSRYLLPLTYYLLPAPPARTQDADKTQQDAGKLHFGPSTCPADQDPWISRAAMGPPVDTCRPISQLPTTHTLHTAHRLFIVAPPTLPCPHLPVTRPVESCSLLFSSVHFCPVLSSLLVCTFPTKHGPSQTSSPRSSSCCLVNVTKTCPSTHLLTDTQAIRRRPLLLRSVFCFV